MFPGVKFYGISPETSRIIDKKRLKIYSSIFQVFHKYS